MMDEIDRRLVNLLQDGFPITERPFAELAPQFGIGEVEILARLEALCSDGWLSRFGPMFDADRLGGATCLAAMEVPEEQFDAVTELVNAHPEVAHNYRRAHALNMWFVLAAEFPDRIDQVIAAIEAETRLSVFAMPKLEEYFVQARFEA
jgi:DNA-binding Lrp family transcriptional regulator